ncbi:arfaptin-1-like [Chanos chanos]|uniref:Arfaptin-1-like n=1 Tax=Chanos chanos TaxID=29144 RepID=A0A6J2VJ20_CHACN|nr:arfaptin-1-like [Chanos chanos]
MEEDLQRMAEGGTAACINGEVDESGESVFGKDPLYADSRCVNNALSSGDTFTQEEGGLGSETYQDAVTVDSSDPVIITDKLKNPAIEKLEQVRKWSISTYKCTRQILSERLGRGSRTVDLDLEARIETLRDLRSRYAHVTKLAQTLASQTAQVSQTQRLLGDAFADLSLKTPQLHEEFGFNADTQKFLSKNGETLLAAINSFIAGMNTLVNQTIEDTMVNVKQYESARVEYDAYRIDLEELNLGPRDDVTLPKIERAQKLYQEHRQKYEKMRDDLFIKLKLLEENRVKVLQKQLILLHSAIAAYYAGNQQKLEQTLEEFHIRLKAPGASVPSWLEDC